MPRKSLLGVPQNKFRIHGPSFGSLENTNPAMDPYLLSHLRASRHRTLGPNSQSVSDVARFSGASGSDSRRVSVSLRPGLALPQNWKCLSRSAGKRFPILSGMWLLCRDPWCLGEQEHAPSSSHCYERQLDAFNHESSMLWLLISNPGLRSTTSWVEFDSTSFLTWSARSTYQQR